MILEAGERTAITTRQDRKLNFIDIETGKSVRTLNAIDTGNPGAVSTLAADQTGDFLVCGVEKTVKLLDMKLDTFTELYPGHGDLVTSLTLINSGSRLVTTSGDGCIFLWRIIGGTLAQVRAANPLALSPFTFNFDDTLLPSWAKEAQSESGRETIKAKPRGMWAQVQTAVLIPANPFI